ncbi:hypothetical protein D3C78_1918750 [compost metagenome]
MQGLYPLHAMYQPAFRAPRQADIPPAQQCHAQPGNTALRILRFDEGQPWLVEKRAMQQINGVVIV